MPTTSLKIEAVRTVANEPLPLRSHEPVLKHRFHRKRAEVVLCWKFQTGRDQSESWVHHSYHRKLTILRRLPTDFCFACDLKLCASGMTPRRRTTFAIHLFLRSIWSAFCLVCFLFCLLSVLCSRMRSSGLSTLSYRGCVGAPSDDVHKP